MDPAVDLQYLIVQFRYLLPYVGRLIFFKIFIHFTESTTTGGLKNNIKSESLEGHCSDLVSGATSTTSDR